MHHFYLQCFFKLCAQVEEFDGLLKGPAVVAGMGIYHVGIPIVDRFVTFFLKTFKMLLNSIFLDWVLTRMDL